MPRYLPTSPDGASTQQHSAASGQRASNWRLQLEAAHPLNTYFVPYPGLLRQRLHAGLIPAQRRHEREQQSQLAAVSVPPNVERGPSPSFIRRAALPKLDWSSSTMCPRQAAHLPRLAHTSVFLQKALLITVHIKMPNCLRIEETLAQLSQHLRLRRKPAHTCAPRGPIIS
ncbi:hypothetical protein V8C44DRAFT_353203 [Trichoderma aethiopicum]